jgi:glycosyltransferase involved in cell wall biosynthesis
MRERDALDMLVEFPERRESPSAVGLTRSVRGAKRPPERGLIVALIHAYNEQDQIGHVVRSLGEQSSPPDLTIVCADNCTDGTALAAEAAGADVFVTAGNEQGRPGGLNQVLDLLLPLLRDDDAVLITDAETSLDSSFLVEARRRLTEGVGGVGGVYTDLDAREFEGLIRSTQYARFVRDLTRLSEKPRVLTGRATLFSVASLWNVFLARAADLLPGDGSGVYNTSSLIPDGELTLALVHLGYSIVAAP